MALTIHGWNFLMHSESANKNRRHGFTYTLISYLMWGILPIYWKLMKTIPSVDILCYRIVFSAIFMFALVMIYKSWAEVRETFINLREFKLLIARAFFLAINWLIYIWGINNDHVIECSFGYFIMPLAVILLSCLFLKEKLNIMEIISSLIALAAVLNLGIKYDHFSWVAIGLALTFGCYALLRKTSRQGALSGLASEVFVLLPFTLIYMLKFTNFSLPAYSSDHLLASMVLIVCTGIVTTVPLILYAYGIRKIKMSMAGIFQYIVPTLTFLIGVFLYKEHFSTATLVSFALIWASVIIYIINMFRDSRA